MNRNFESKEIIKVIDAMVGRTEAVGETREDKRRLDNLKTLIDITNWCMDGVRFAMESGKGRQESSMSKIGRTAQLALDEYRTCLNEILEVEGDDNDYERASDMRDYCEMYEPTYNQEDGSM